MPAVIIGDGAPGSLYLSVNPGVATRGLKAETANPINGLSGLASSDGTVVYVGFSLFAGMYLTGACITVIAGGTVMTVSKVGIYSSTLSLLAASADQGTTWQTAGSYSIPFTAPLAVPSSGLYYAALIAKGGGIPTFARAGQSVLLFGSLNSGAVPYGRQTGQTDLPATGAIVPAATTEPPIWFGVY